MPRSLALQMDRAGRRRRCCDPRRSRLRHADLLRWPADPGPPWAGGLAERIATPDNRGRVPLQPGLEHEHERSLGRALSRRHGRAVSDLRRPRQRAAVQAVIRESAGDVGTVKATESLDVGTSSGLPFVDLFATAPTAAQAQSSRQMPQRSSAHTSSSSRPRSGSRRTSVSSEVVQSGGNTELLEGHKPTIPVLVFVAVLIGVVSLVFLKEGIRPGASEAGRGSGEGAARPASAGVTSSRIAEKRSRTATTRGSIEIRGDGPQRL